MTTPAPLDDAAWPAEIDDLRAGFAGRLNVYRVMAHHPDLLRAWAPLRDHVVRRSALGPERSEIVILRTGVRLGSAYEWAHHVVRARKLGMAEARIAALRGDPGEMGGEDALLARAVDEIMDARRLSEATDTALEAAIGRAAVFDLIATVGFYSVLGVVLNSYAPPLDEDIRAALAAHPLP